MNPPRFFPVLLVACPLALSLSGGCVFIPTPAPAPTPKPVPTPHGDQFNPADGAPKGVELNKAGDAKLPDAFRVALVVSGQELVLQSVKTVTGPGGKKSLVLGAADTLNPVRLAGIVTPTGTQTGAAEAAATLNSWTAGQDLDVQIDPVFPTDVDNKRRVAIFFKGRNGPTKGQIFNLNRMMVRSGYAVVDLYSPTSFDQKQWLYDETYAREHLRGLWKTDVFRQLQQRVKLPSQGTGAKSAVGLQLPLPGAAPQNPVIVTAPGTTTTTTTTSTNAVTTNSAATNSAATNSAQ